ncbi:MAG: transposase [Alteromonadaceae bacterium]|jgi:transposase
MKAYFSKAFKLQAVEKALIRRDSQSLKEIAESLDVGYSTLSRWITQSKNNELESDPNSTEEIPEVITMAKREKRPQDWSLEERLQIVMECHSLDEEALSALCRAKGLYVHHINQWKEDFIKGTTVSNKVKEVSETKDLKKEIRTLKKDLNRKDRALAETAALLVLQKKVNLIWGSEEEDEDDSQ